MTGMTDREAYLSLADEMDPVGALTPPTWDENDWDSDVVAGARRFAALHRLPFPMMDGIDHALDLVSRAEENDR